MSIIKNNQSAFDISTQIHGNVRSVVDFCIKNNFPITADFEPSTPYEDTETVYTNEIVQEFFFNREFELTTGVPKVEDLIDPIGIGTMIIESDFDVT